MLTGPRAASVLALLLWHGIVACDDAPDLPPAHDTSVEQDILPLPDLAPPVDAAPAVEGAPDPCRLTTPGATWIAYASKQKGNYDIYRIRADGTCRRQITSDPGGELSPSWTPDGKKIAYCHADSFKISVLDLVTGAGRHLDLGGLRAVSPAVSPDGKWIAFAARKPTGSKVNIYKVAFGGGTPVKLTDLALAASPTWSPAGDLIYFISSASGPQEVHQVSADGSSVVPVTKKSLVLGRVSAAPDGLTLAYTRRNGSTPEVVIMDLSTLSVQVLRSKKDTEPDFDAAGKRIVLTTFEYGDPELVVVGVADGKELIRLTREKGVDATAAFAPK